MLLKQAFKLLLFFSIIFFFSMCTNIKVNPSDWDFSRDVVTATIRVTDSLTGTGIPGAQFGDYKNFLSTEYGWIWIEVPGTGNKTVTDSVRAQRYKSKLLTITLSRQTKDYYISLMPN